jgi:hypothetical protein
LTAGSYGGSDEFSRVFSVENFLCLSHEKIILDYMKKISISS